MTRHLWSERVGRGFLHSYDVEILHEERTPYQHLQVFHTPLWGRMLVLDGIVQLTEGDEAVYHEMMVHVPLSGLARPPEKVLVIGGGDGGAMREVLRHDSVRRAVQVELDEAVIRACRKYLPEITCDWNDPRVTLVIGDGARYMAEAAERGETFDVILIDSTDPVGPSMVLFERPFHEALRRCLAEDGAAVRQASLPFSMPDVMPFVMARFREVFPWAAPYRAPVPTYGDEMAFVAGTRDGASLSEPRENRLGRYYNPDCHRAAFALPTWWHDRIADYRDDGRVPVVIA
ncbi:polyamine aminopropyltransferase [Dissulfurirhabdus thermomarina]|uniref:Polyamine aminopropyltransferase n=1 Tax=Dissulfurirhabdus thermomarina TaxID=1765737 RepID=A0A6N9TTP5_DISTH|nr:polyamine aminopropyltransferase [Dissulfurirhabdus thermomarina]NDY43114.1 polyamine aminopropyltransferase [Dissulfurirhabdus thermomarina]NMX24444.1 polyamine aminopropyltransferase [Dissulfurirhabdus thermomarina]